MKKKGGCCFLTCYSAKYVGDKCYTYKLEHQRLVRKLVRKITRKLEKVKLANKFYLKVYRKGYNLGDGDVFLNRSFSIWTIHKDEHSFDEDYVFFDFQYDTEYLVKNNIFDWLYEPSKTVTYTLNPRDILIQVREESMLEKTPILIELNKELFRIIIPLSYYNYTKEYTYENKKYNKRKIGEIK